MKHIAFVLLFTFSCKTQTCFSQSDAKLLRDVEHFKDADFVVSVKHPYQVAWNVLKAIENVEASNESNSNDEKSADSKWPDVSQLKQALEDNKSFLESFESIDVCFRCKNQAVQAICIIQINNEVDFQFSAKVDNQILEYLSYLGLSKALRFDSDVFLSKEIQNNEQNAGVKTIAISSSDQLIDDYERLLAGELDSLQTGRPFLRVEADLDRGRFVDESGGAVESVEIYCSPNFVESVYFEEGERLDNALCDNTSGFGGRILFTTEGEVFFNFVGVRTQPSSGISLVYDALQPIKSMPELSFEPNSLYSYALDPSKYWAALVTRHDEKNGIGSYEKSLRATKPAEYFDNCMNSIDGFLHAMSPNGERLTIFHLNDSNRYGKWLDWVVAQNEKEQQIKYQVSEENGWKYWRPDNISLCRLWRKNNQEKNADDQAIIQAFEDGEFSVDSFALGSRFSIQGASSLVKKEIEVSRDGKLKEASRNSQISKIDAFFLTKVLPCKVWSKRSGGFINWSIFQNASELLTLRRNRSSGATDQRGLHSDVRFAVEDTIFLIQECVSDSLFALSSNQLAFRIHGVAVIGPK